MIRYHNFQFIREKCTTNHDFAFFVFFICMLYSICNCFTRRYFQVFDFIICKTKSTSETGNRETCNTNILSFCGNSNFNVIIRLHLRPHFLPFQYP